MLLNLALDQALGQAGRHAEVAVDLVGGVHVEQVGVDVFFQLRVNAFLRIVAAAERGVHVDQPRGAPSGAYAVFSGKAAAVVHGFLDGGGVFGGVEHIPFISRKQAVQVADVAVALLDFLKGFQPFPDAAVLPDGRLGNARQELAGFCQYGRIDSEFPARGDVVAAGLPCREGGHGNMPLETERLIFFPVSSWTLKTFSGEVPGPEI